MSGAKLEGASFDGKTGELVLTNGQRFAFLPPKPANSPPYEFIVTETFDGSREDGNTHYLIGGDSALVDQIVKWYADKGTPVPDGYADEAARHAAAVQAELDKAKA